MESFNSNKIMIYKKINNIDKNKGTNSKYIYSKSNTNIINKERQKFNYYIFPEFNYHYGNKSKQNYYNINTPHFSIYSDSPLILNENSRNDLLNESIQLKKEKNKLKNELNREKALKDVGSQYLKLLKNKYFENNFNIHKNEEENKINNDEYSNSNSKYLPGTNFNNINNYKNKLNPKEINNINNNSSNSNLSETSKLILLADKVLENYKTNKTNENKMSNNKFFNYKEYKEKLKENITNANDTENDLNSNLNLNEIIKKYKTINYSLDRNIIKDHKEDTNNKKDNSYYHICKNNNENKTTINNDLNSVNSTIESFNKSSDNIIKNNTLKDSLNNNIKSIEFEKNAVNKRYIIVDENRNPIIINGKKLLGMDLIALGEDENGDIILMGPDGEPKTPNELEPILLDDNRPLVNDQNRPFLGLCGVPLINSEGYPVVGPGELYDKNESKAIGSLGFIAKDNNGNPLSYLIFDDNKINKNEEENSNDNKYIFNGKYIRIIEHNIDKSRQKSNDDFNDNNRPIHFIHRYKKLNNISKKLNNKPRIRIKKRNRRRDKMEKGKLTFSKCDINSVKKIKYFNENDYKVTCFACDVGCSVSKTGYSRMNYSPYNNLIRRREETPTK